MWEGELTAKDKVTAKLAALSYLFLIKKAIRNWQNLVFFKMGLMKTTKLKLNSGKVITIKDEDDFFNFIHRDKLWARELIAPLRLPIKVEKNKVSVRLLGKNIKFYYDSEPLLGTTLTLLIDIFTKGEYSSVNVKDKSVVDIGASIGDSPIYFVLKGARRVYALEPFPYVYRAAKRNIAINGMSSRVTMLNAGIGSKKGSLAISDEYVSSVVSDINESRSQKGKMVPIISLDDLVSRYKIKNAVLKMDCEGAEMEAVLKCRNDTLAAFSQIVMEYHYGYKSLERKLRSAGFKVSHTQPKYFGYSNVKNPDMYIGIIHAKRQ